MRASVRACECVRACVRANVCVRLWACVRAYECVRVDACARARTQAAGGGYLARGVLGPVGGVARELRGADELAVDDLGVLAVGELYLDARRGAEVLAAQRDRRLPRHRALRRLQAVARVRRADDGRHVEVVELPEPPVRPPAVHQHPVVLAVVGEGAVLARRGEGALHEAGAARVRRHPLHAPQVHAVDRVDVLPVGPRGAARLPAEDEELVVGHRLDAERDVVAHGLRRRRRGVVGDARPRHEPHVEHVHVLEEAAVVPPPHHQQELGLRAVRQRDERRRVVAPRPRRRAPRLRLGPLHLAVVAARQHVHVVVEGAALPESAVSSKDYQLSKGKYRQNNPSVMIDIAGHYSMFTNSFVELNSVSVRA